MVDDEAILLALRARLLTTSGIPAVANRVKVNKGYKPVQGTPYLEEDFVPAPPALKSFPPQGGTVEGRGLYVLRWYGVANTGSAAIRAGVLAILAKFAIGTALSLTNGDVVRIAGSPTGPYAGRITPTENGFALCTITIPYWLTSQNAIVA